SGRDMDLGISGGIQSSTPHAGLASISSFAADIQIRLSGDLRMTSSRIDSTGLHGSIDLEAGGSIDVGSQESIFSSRPKGIYTCGGGGIRVQAGGDINVNGSRIATYNGGDLSVHSLSGHVDAGEGGLGYVSINSSKLDPESGKLIDIRTSIPG